MSDGRKGVTQLFYVNIHTKKVGGGGVKRLDKRDLARAPPHVQLWVFSYLGKTVLDIRPPITYN